MQETEKLYDQLSRNHDDCFFHFMYPVKESRESGEEKRTVDISETEGFQDIYEDPLRNTWTDYEHPGKTRTKDFFTCLQCSEKNYRI